MTQVVNTTFKECTNCKEMLPISMFVVESRRKSGYGPRCKPCANSYNKLRAHKSNKYKKDTTQYKTCNMCNLVKAGSEMILDSRIKHGLGHLCIECNRIQRNNARWAQLGYINKDGTTFTYADYRVLNNNMCDICGISESRGKNSSNWHVDHDHKTGVVRGLLCNYCNSRMVSAIEVAIDMGVLEDVLEYVGYEPDLRYFS